MESKIYFFAKHRKRETPSKKPKDPPQSKIQVLTLPKKAKPISISPIYSNSSPYHIKKPTSLYPLFKTISPQPRSRSYRLVNAPKPILEKKKNKTHKSIIPRRLNMRYLKQDYEDVEVMNYIRTPEESRKNSTKKFSTDWLIPEFDQVFVNSQTKTSLNKANLAISSYDYSYVKNNYSEPNHFDFTH